MEAGVQSHFQKISCWQKCSKHTQNYKITRPQDVLWSCLVFLDFLTLGKVVCYPLSEKTRFDHNLSHSPLNLKILTFLITSKDFVKFFMEIKWKQLNLEFTVSTILHVCSGQIHLFFFIKNQKFKQSPRKSLIC